MSRPHSVAVMMSLGLHRRLVKMGLPCGHWSGVVVRRRVARTRARSIVLLAVPLGDVSSVYSLYARRAASPFAAMDSDRCKGPYDELLSAASSCTRNAMGVINGLCKARGASSRPRVDSHRAFSGLRRVLFDGTGCISRGPFVYGFIEKCIFSQRTAKRRVGLPGTRKVVVSVPRVVVLASSQISRTSSGLPARCRAAPARNDAVKGSACVSISSRPRERLAATEGIVRTGVTGSVRLRSPDVRFCGGPA